MTGICRYVATKATIGEGYNLILTVAPGEAINPLDVGRLEIRNISKDVCQAECDVMQRLGYEMRSIMREGIL